MGTAYAAFNANDGQACVSHDLIEGSALAEFAAKDAAKPKIRSAHGNTPPWPPQRASLRRIMEVSTIIVGYLLVT